ncbi:uncharacterized protein ARB_02512 [Trichophyton benhamiae CBS 112371]|uniref:Uncharacterized protein n=1 Tax=Arthroderma benhamiae (strain ATCC MYA-4681 / CBS 112371) TaxID=663331 RepID=D4B229_ARTBC|nr:uncharacterized protein ARB_02512 [Trichophyton benhamiae CBS 112371]EFE30590.1 hypothetical protein ARB_02512 [Trichophyton benhamiae CBS 112371]
MAHLLMNEKFDTSTFLAGLAFIENIEDFISFSMSIGSIGRKNIVSLELHWESKAGIFSTVRSTRVKEDHKSPQLVAVSPCVKVRGTPRRIFELENITSPVDDGMLNAVHLESFKTHPRNLELCSLKVERVHLNGFESSLDRNQVSIEMSLSNGAKELWNTH